jgi:hypothetical protein
MTLPGILSGFNDNLFLNGFSTIPQTLIFKKILREVAESPHADGRTDTKPAVAFANLRKHLHLLELSPFV